MTTTTVFTAGTVADLEGLPSDMRREAAQALTSGQETCIDYRRSGMYGTEPTHFIFFPNAGRGGVASGADTDWTDCDSLDDLEDRWQNYEDRWCN